jgi:hypothetical protein
MRSQRPSLQISLHSSNGSKRSDPRSPRAGAQPVWQGTVLNALYDGRFTRITHRRRGN